VFLFPSETETFGNVVLEAMASRLAVVAYQYAAAGAHLRAGDSGVLVRAGASGAFVSAAVEAAQAPATVARMRDGREAALALDWDAVVTGSRDSCRVARSQGAGAPPRRRRSLDATTVRGLSRAA
jgi:glycosyltransferase involved in cell wall biosynthesis